jgi:diguanylate cyclase (GGDEF)-like protein
MSNTEPTARARILIIDDSPAAIHVLARALAPEFVFEFALSGLEALARLGAGDPPDLILLDILMPGMDGHEVLRRLKTEAPTQNIPVIVITASNDPEGESSALLAGAADFIHKPVNPHVLRLRVGLHVLLRERERALCALNEEIRQLAFYDPLTGLPNRRLLMDRLERPTLHLGHRQDFGALFFIDLDNFKALNDRLGHTAGDQVLKEVARRLTRCVRNTDTVARLGGDEFVVVFEHLSAPYALASSQAETVGHKVLAALDEPYQLGEHAHSVTSSIGVVLFEQNGQPLNELLDAADQAMYQAKAAGRNAVRLLNPVPSDAAGEQSGAKILPDRVV